MIVLEEKHWTSIVTCTGNGNEQQGCGSVLEINKEDIRYYPGKSGDPSIDGTFFYDEEEAVIRCPVCGTITDLTPKERPIDFRECVKFTTSWRYGNE